MYVRDKFEFDIDSKLWIVNRWIKYQFSVFFLMLTVLIYFRDFCDSSSFPAGTCWSLKPYASYSRLIAFLKSNSFYWCFLTYCTDSSFTYTTTRSFWLLLDSYLYLYTILRLPYFLGLTKQDSFPDLMFGELGF